MIFIGRTNSSFVRAASERRQDHCCGWSSFLLEEQAAVGADGPGERGRRRHGPPDDKLPPLPPAGAENRYFGIAAGLGEEEELGERGEGRCGAHDGAVLAGAIALLK